MSIAEKLSKIASNVPKVYEAGLLKGKQECKNFHIKQSNGGQDWTLSGNSVVLNCPYGAKMVIFKATDATIDGVIEVAKSAAYDETNQQYPYYTYGAVLQLFDFDTKSFAASQNQNSTLFCYSKLKDYESFGPTGTTGVTNYAKTEDEKIRFGVLNFTTEYTKDGVTVPAEYEWTAYYWDE